MDIAAYVARGLISALTFGWTLLVPSRKKRIDHTLAARPRTWIKAAEGAVKVTGRIHRDRELLVAPLSGRPCVFYELVVSTQVPGAGRSGPVWRRLVDVQQGCSFFVVDDSGTARIDTSGPCLVALSHDRTGVAKGKYPGEHGALSSLLEARGLKARTWLGDWRPVYYSEGVLEPGVLVAVAGDGRQEIIHTARLTASDQCQGVWSCAEPSPSPSSSAMCARIGDAPVNRRYARRSVRLPGQSALDWSPKPRGPNARSTGFMLVRQIQNRAKRWIALEELIRARHVRSCMIGVILIERPALELRGSRHGHFAAMGG